MSEMMLAMLSNIRTVEDMVAAFRDEEPCRRLLESMVWPNGRGRCHLNLNSDARETFGFGD